jgi:hypothetical protein
MEAIIRLVDSNIPAANSSYLLIVQASTGSSTSPGTDDTRALPWKEDVFGVAQDIFYADPSLSLQFDDISLSAANELIDHFGGEDHRMFWGAYGEPQIKADWPKYYDSEDKFETLREIKECVDPSNHFRNKMSIPLPDRMDDTDDISETSNGVSIFSRSGWIFKTNFSLGIAVLLCQRRG